MLKPSRGNNFVAIVMVYMFLLQFTAAPLIRIILDNIETTVSADMLMALVFQIIGFFIPAAAYVFVTRQPVSAIAPNEKLSFTNIFLILCCLVFSVPLVAIISALSSLFFGVEVSAILLQYSAQPFFIIVLVSCVCPAVLEELIMRGIVLSNYKNVGVKKAALMNGLLFGAMHLNFEQFFYAFFLGFIFAYFVYYTKNIWTSVICHFLVNFMSTYLVYAVYNEAAANGQNIEELFKPQPFGEQLYSILQLSGFALFTTIIFLIVFNYFIAYNKRINLLREMKIAMNRQTSDPENIQGGVYTQPGVLSFGFWFVIVFFLLNAAFTLAT